MPKGDDRGPLREGEGEGEGGTVGVVERLFRPCPCVSNLAHRQHRKPSELMREGEGEGEGGTVGVVERLFRPCPCVSNLAHRQHRKPSELMREAVEEYIQNHSA
ncbi:hypothetical protein [Rhodococcus wratislaviensis]|uniref:hypothetical protein n=1 Tax=Rhodococcus wratislaviensis TaxID=44752 RepID=UPI003647BD6F